MPAVVTTPMPTDDASPAKPRIVQIGTSPRNRADAAIVPLRGSLSKPSVARCSAVSSVHGSTPSSRNSFGRGGSRTPGGADGVPATTVVHPAASTAVTSRGARRTARR